MRSHLLLALSMSACDQSLGFMGDLEPRDTASDGAPDGDTEAPSAETGGAEVEDDRLALRPAETDVYVFIANPADDSVTRVNASTLEVRTVAVGLHPTAVAATADFSTAVVFNQGDSTVSILDAATLDVTVVPVRPNLNTLKVSPDGRWAVLWHDVGAERADDVTQGAATSYNEVSLVDLPARRHHGLVVGFNPKSIQFTRDGRLALAVADASLASIDLTGDAPSPSFLPIADPLDTPAAEEVEIAPSGAFAFVRQRSRDTLTIVDLTTREVTPVPVPAGPTDIDLSADGSELIVVSRAAAATSRFAVDDPYAAAVVTQIPGDTRLGSILLPETGDAVLYTTASNLGRYATWDLTSNEVTLHPLHKPAAGMALTAGGASLLVVHDVSDNDDGSTPEAYKNKPGLSLISLADQRTNTLSLSEDISGYSVSGDGAHGYAILEGRSVLEVLDYRTLLHDEVALRSAAVFVGTLPRLSPTDPEPKAWVSQEHPLGRITFYDPADAATTTITGFALNGQIED